MNLASVKFYMLLIFPINLSVVLLLNSVELCEKKWPSGLKTAVKTG